MTIWCRQLDVAGSDRDVEVGDPREAPSEYADVWVDVPVGAMTFVERLDGGEWSCWDVERLGDWPGHRVYRTLPATAERLA